MSENYPHEKSQIIGSGMNQVAFADIFQTAKRHPGKIATPLGHGKTSFRNLGTQAGQLFSVVSPSAAAIAVKEAINGAVMR